MGLFSGPSIRDIEVQFSKFEGELKRVGGLKALKDSNATEFNMMIETGTTIQKMAAAKLGDPHLNSGDTHVCLGAIRFIDEQFKEAGFKN